MLLENVADSVPWEERFVLAKCEPVCWVRPGQSLHGSLPTLFVSLPACPVCTHPVLTTGLPTPGPLGESGLGQWDACSHLKGTHGLCPEPASSCWSIWLGTLSTASVVHPAQVLYMLAALISLADPSASLLDYCG